MATYTPDEMVRWCADRLLEDATAMRTELERNSYFHGPGDLDQRYRLGVDGGLGGPAGTYAGRWTPQVCELLYELMDALADKLSAEEARLERRSFPGEDDRMFVIDLDGTAITAWTWAWRLAVAYLGDDAKPYLDEQGA